MSSPTENHFRRLVEQQLKRSGFVEPPVTLDTVAAHLSVPVREVPFPGWFSGAIVIEDGMPLIWVNSHIAPEAKRAALGHMLGHILMRLDDPDTPYPRETGDHAAADEMSEEFVMPEFMVREQAARWFNDYRYLSRMFGVSEADMMERMRQLDIIKARGVAWDY